jgi:hypothetical protein
LRFRPAAVLMTGALAVAVAIFALTRPLFIRFR